MLDLKSKSSILNTVKELKEITYQEFKRGTSLVIQWLRLNTSNAGNKDPTYLKVQQIIIIILMLRIDKSIRQKVDYWLPGAGRREE